MAIASSDGMRFWGHEWDKHGTCSQSYLGHHSYFKATLDLKIKVNLSFLRLRLERRNFLLERWQRMIRRQKDWLRLKVGSMLGLDPLRCRRPRRISKGMFCLLLLRDLVGYLWLQHRPLSQRLLWCKLEPRI